MNREPIISIRWRTLVTVCLSMLISSLATGEAMLQYFNTSWVEITRRMPELAEVGYSSLWLPPPTKGSGGLSVGYDLWDPFDLGGKDQRGTFRTRYGTEAELHRLIETAHRFGLRVYFDNIMNHRAFDVPGYNDHAPPDLYPGMRPEDFHLRRTTDGYYRKWDNVREWWSEWQVQNLGLADLVDIATEPGTTNRNFGAWEGSTADKIKFLRHPYNPEYYCYDANGSYVGFGKDNGLTDEYLSQNDAFYSEYVEDYLHRAVRWLLDCTKADGLRLDAVKHIPADFFGATFGADRDHSAYGYLGQSQEQFNLTRGFSDWDNHRDTVFDTERPRDDAMMFGEHLGEPPSVEGYINAGMRLLDNNLRHYLNGQLGSPWGSLQGLDSSGGHGFPPEVSVMHAQSHDSDYAARRELQHALYLTRGGIGIIYSDGNHKAGILKESGGAFPRHANTNFLGQWGDNRIPNLLYAHEHFARGYQVGRWSDGDVVIYERVDKRENPSMSDGAGTVGLVMINDNYASGQVRNFTTGFPAVGGTDNDAYLYNYSSYGGGFYKYASKLHEVVIPQGGYFVFSWRSPEASDLWERAGGHPLIILQDGKEVETMTIRRTDGSDGDPGFNPYGLPDDNTTDFSYFASIPRVTGDKKIKFVVRADGSAENVMLKLDGGIDVNGNGRRDNPPALSTDVFLGYEQMNFVDRQGPEKFAARDVGRNVIGSFGAETFLWDVASRTFSSVNGSGDGARFYPDYSAEWVYHDPEQNNDQGEKQFKVVEGTATVWVKVGNRLDVNQARLYHVADGSNPEGAGGVGIGSTQVAPFVFSHSDGQEATVDWWKTSITLPSSGVLKYKIGVWRGKIGDISPASVFPKNAPAVALKKKMLTTFEIDDFDAATITYHPHNDYGETATGLKEGFHIVRGRAFLNRLGEASIYNTFSRTFYYDTKRPQGVVVHPEGVVQELFGSEYGFVIRTDPSVTEVLFHIDDGDVTNDDDQTGAINGNGVRDAQTVTAWAHAEEIASRQNLDATYPKEWRFSYRNVPSGGEEATVRIALREASSSTDLSLGDEEGHFRILTCKVKTSGPSHRLFVTWPQRDGDKVGQDYIMKTCLSSGLVDGRSDAEVIANLIVSIDGSVNQEAPYASAVPQDVSTVWVERNVSPGLAALAYKLPILRNPDGAPDDFRQTIIVDYKDAGASVDLRAVRTVATDFVSHGPVNPIVAVNGVSADYTTTNLFVDEVERDEETLEVVLEAPHITVAEVYTNLNNRDLATGDSNEDGIEDGIQPPDRDSVSLANNDGYYQVHAMTFDPTRGETGAWVCQLNARKTGAYRLTARFKLEGDADVWHWYTSDGRRDHAVVVTPKTVRGAVMYELNPLTVDATGDTFATRSTLEDLHDENRWNLEYLKGIGANWLWFQPIHPRGTDGCEIVNGQPYDPGSPYAVKNFFEVMPQLSEGNTRPAAMQAFKDFVTAADAEGVGVMVDAPFNHVAWDAELDEEGVEIFGGGAPDDEIRKVFPGFFSRESDYGLPARGENEIATAPDRDDFGKWEDVKDVYFGNYSSLVRGNDPAERSPHQNEGDAFDYAGEGWNDQTRRTWKYFASYIPYWLDKTGLPKGQSVSVQAQTGIDGLRADFGQGLPPQLWEYIINVARSRKWSFVFMSEALDGGAVTYRSSRHFDVLNENIVFALQVSTTPVGYRAAFENRRSAYGESLVLLNNVSHDEENHQDPWEALIRYAVASTNDGVPMLFMGQELGISSTYGFNHYETNFGKQIPHFKRYNSMQPIWDNSDFGLDQLYNAYASIGRARATSPALRSPPRYFLNELSTNSAHSKIHATAKREEFVASPSTSDLVLTFVNLDRDNQQSGIFDLSPDGNETLFGFQKDHLYNVSNLSAFQAEEADKFLWTQARSGQDLLENGIFVRLNPVPKNLDGWSTAPYEVQFLKVHDLSVLLLEVNVTDGGSATGAGTHAYGNHVNIQATAQPGYAFDKWLGDGVAEPTNYSTTISMTQPRAVTATFRYVGSPETMPTISEFMASNDKTLLSSSGDSYDWIEVHNPGTNSVDLSDWYLTNDPANPTVWRFPAGTTLGGDERLVVFASGLGSAGTTGGSITRPSDLLAYWPFDEGSGTSTTDQSENNHDIANIGGATWADGKFGKALSYDGGATSLPLGAHPPASGNEFSISFWSYGDPAKLPGKNTSVIESNGPNGRILNIHFPWNNRHVYWDAGNGGYDRINTAIADSYLWGNWSHWVFVHNRATGDQQYYLNGTEQVAATGRNRQLGTANRWYLGANLNGNGSYWYGKVDELRLYGIELSSTEAESVYRETPNLEHVVAHTTFRLNASGGYLALIKGDGTVGKIFANYPEQEGDYAYGTPEKTKGLIAHWKFDETSGAVAKDSIAPPSGLIAGGLSSFFNLIDPNPGDLNGNGSGATDGIDPLGPTLGNLSSKPPWQDNFTVVYTGQIYDADGRVSFSENIDDAVWLNVNGQVLLNDTSWNSQTTKTVELETGGWYDFELRMGNDSSGAGPVTSPGFGFDPDGGTNFIFPKNASVGSGDLFRTRGSLDASITGQSSPTWEQGRFGNALRFDGTDDVATHSLPSSVTLATYTLSLWVKPDGVNQANYVSFFNSGSTGQDFQIGFDGGGRYKLLGDGGNGVFGSASVDWSHLAVVSNGSSRKLYMNGAYVVSVANADNVFQHYRFGVNRGGNKFFRGWLDEVRLLDFALSDEQVFDLFENKTSPSANYLMVATPGKANGESFPGFVADTKFNVDRGFFETPFSLAITSATPGAIIRYTTDGSTPSTTHGTIYTNPITIASTTVLRAIATKPDYVSSGVDTQSYFFLWDVIRQSADGATPSGWPASNAVNNQKMVYGMDPDIVEGFNKPEEVKESLLSIPTLSIVTELDNLFGQSNGIFVNARSDGRTWERPMSLELIHPDGSKGFQTNAGLRIRGGYSRSPNNPKHSFRIFFRSEYGQGNLHYPMFEDEGVEEFDKFDLRTSQNYSWAFGGPANNTMVREVWSRDTQAAMNQPYTRSRYYHLYLNGTYWGIYMTQERASGTLGESYLGGDKDDYDTVHQDASRQINATSGNIEAYDRLWQRTIDGWTDNGVYFRAQGFEVDGKTTNPSYERLLDVDNLIDYMLVVYYNGDRDGPASRYTTPRVNNYYAIYNRVNPDGWKFPAHDMEHSLGRGENNMVTPLASAHRDRDEKKYFTAHFLHEQLTSNQEYVLRFADRFYLRNYNDGVLTEENAKARIAFRAAQIDKAIIAESARWGDTKSSVPKNRTDWLNNVKMVTDWMSGRNAVVLNQLRTTRLNANSPNWYPGIDPPGFSQHGGQVGSTFRLTMNDPNFPTTTIYYTLDDSDPRLIGGNVSASAQTVQSSGMQNALLLDAGESAKAMVPTNESLSSAWTLPGFDDSGWLSGSTGIGYDTATTYHTLYGINVLSSMRNKNTSVYCRIPFTVSSASEFTNLTLKMKYDDGFVAYLNGTRVASAAAPANLTWNAKATSSHNDSAAQQYVSFDLTPHLDQLRDGANILAIHGLNVSTGSSDMLIVPRIEASKVVGGAKITLPHPLTTVKARTRNSSGEWSALHEAVFQVNVVPASAENLAISEIMYNPAGTGGAEYVEITNVGSLRIDLTGVTLGSAFDDFTFGSLTLAPGENAVVVEDLADFNARYLDPASPYYSLGIIVAGEWPRGKLNNAGEAISLSDAKGVDILTFKYDNGGNWPARADGRGSSLILPDSSVTAGMTSVERNAFFADGDNWKSSTDFHGSPGGSESTGSAESQVLISEILAHTDSPLVDAIELHNSGSQPVNVGGWRLTESASSLLGFRIPDGTVIPPGGYLVFDETDFNPNGLWNPNAGSRGPNEFALSGARGGDIWLIRADASGNLLSFADHVEFGASFNGVSFGRWPNGSNNKLYPMQERSLFDEPSSTYPPTKRGGPNPSPRRAEVMVSEIMYNPPSANVDLEFIELYNSGETVVSLSGWQLDKGIDFAFTSGTLLKPGQSLVVVGFDLNATDKLATFRTTYGIGTDVVVVGGWKGNLNNDGETISLLRPDVPPPDDPAHTPMVIEESLTYSNSPPWPAGADGNGSSLVRNKHSSWANDPQSWWTSTGKPSPGPSPNLNTPPVFFGGQPPSLIAVGTMFRFRFFALDPDANDLSFSSNSNPFWLTLTDEGNGSALLSGKPPPYTVGTHTVSITVSDAIASPVEKTFALMVEDKTSPILTLRGSATHQHEAGTPYLDAGVVAADAVDGDLSAKVAVVNPVKVGAPGTYLVSYSVSDKAGNSAKETTRTVVVADTSSPILHLLGGGNIIHEAGTPFLDAGAYAVDVLDGNLTNIVVGGAVNANVQGLYQLTYDATDAAGNSAARLIRNVNVVDTKPPTITLLGSSKIRHLLTAPFVDLGVVATDAFDGNLTNKVLVGGNLDLTTSGTYSITYDVSDDAGNAATRVSREVTIVVIPPPVITLSGSVVRVLNEGEPYTEAGFAAFDSEDGNLTDTVVVGGDEVDSNIPGSYRVTYDVTNSRDVKASQVGRMVIVRDVTPPVITLIGGQEVNSEAAVPYVDPGVSAFDNADGNLTATITISGFVDVNVPGVYQLSYEVSDGAGNIATRLTRSITVSDTTSPSLTILGESNATHEAGSMYNERGVTAFDLFDGNLTQAVIVSGELNASKLGSYALTYSATDASGNVAAVTRRIQVVDSTAPNFNLRGSASMSVELGIPFVDPGVNAFDSFDGDLSHKVVIAGDGLQDDVEGEYLRTYSVSDNAGNIASTLTRSITVRDTLLPTVELLGDKELTHPVGTPFVDPGTNARDFADGNLSSKVRVTSSVDTHKIGDYSILYEVFDGAGNNAIPQVRKVSVRSLASPVITLVGPAFVTLDQGEDFVDPGVTAFDEFDGNLTERVRTENNLDVNVPGIHHIVYSVINASELEAEEIFRTIVVNDLNDAPSTNGIDALLSTISEGAGSGTLNPGDAVSFLVEGITDLDSKDSAGLALVAKDETNGVWQYSLDGGITFQAVGPISEHTALLLRADDPQTLLRFVPGVEFHGSSAVTFMAWDQTVGRNGERMSIVSGGGRSAFSADSAFAVITVTPRSNKPYFSTAPVVRGKILQPYVYRVAVREPTGESFTILSGAMPSWLTFTVDPNGTATLAGTPGVEDVGAHAVILKAVDTSGQYSEQSFAIAVSSGKAFDLEIGWNAYDWFGDFYVSPKTWIFHRDHGWLFPSEKIAAAEEGIWFWSESLGWHWTRKDIYPFIYLRERQRSKEDVYHSADLFVTFSWYYYSRSSREPRLFFDYTINDWIPGSRFGPVFVSANVNDLRGGIVVGAGYHGNGDAVSLVAKPNSGYKFSRWSGAMQGSLPILAFTVAHDLSLTAHFEKLSEEEIFQGVFD